MFEQLFQMGFGTLIFLVAAIFMWMFVVGAVRWTAGPMLQGIADSPRAPTFQLSDLIWLVLQFQLVMAVVSYAFPQAMPSNMRITALVLFSMPVVLFWLASLHLVSRAGIRKPIRRAAVFLILLPGVALTILLVPILTVEFLSSLVPRLGNDPSGASPIMFGSQLAILALFSLVLRLLSRWVIARPTA